MITLGTCILLAEIIKNSSIRTGPAGIPVGSMWLVAVVLDTIGALTIMVLSVAAILHLG